MEDEVNRAEWQSTDNWWGGPLGLYASRRDTRVWVPRRIPGLLPTLNLARPAAWLWVAVILGGPALLLWTLR
jgi:uncharacterized membrane protein